MLSVNFSGRRVNSLPSFSSSLISTKLKLRIHDTSKFGSRLTTSQPSIRLISSSSLPSFPPTRLQPFGRVNLNIHLRPCIYAQFFSTSAKSSVATSSSSAAAAKLQTRQRLKWKIIARVAYYLRVRFICVLFDFYIHFRLYDTSCALLFSHIAHLLLTSKHIILTDSISCVVSIWHWVSARYHGLFT